MSDVKSGTVSKVYSNSFDDGNMSHSFKLAGDPKYYRCGKNRFAGIVEEGNVIKFKRALVNDKADKVIGTPKLGSSADRAQANTATADAGGKGWGSNDAAIRYQSARKDALVMAGMALTSGAIKLPAKEAGKLEVLEALVDRYTAAFYADIETKGAVARTAPAKVEEKAAEPEDEDEEEVALEDDEWD